MPHDEPPKHQRSASEEGGEDLSQLRVLAELREQGVITEHEFAAKKAAILGVSQRKTRGPRSRRFKWVTIGIATLLLLGGAGTGLVLKIRHDNEVQAAKERADDERARIAQAARDQKLAADAAADLRREQEQLERDVRQDLEQDLRRSITKHARAAVADGVLDGPIKRTSCDPVGGGRDDLEASTGKYECLAIRTERSDGTASGYGYTGTINYDKGSWTWQLDQ